MGVKNASVTSRYRQLLLLLLPFSSNLVFSFDSLLFCTPPDFFQQLYMCAGPDERLVCLNEGKSHSLGVIYFVFSRLPRDTSNTAHLAKWTFLKSSSTFNENHWEQSYIPLGTWQRGWNSRSTPIPSCLSLFLSLDKRLSTKRQILNYLLWVRIQLCFQSSDSNIIAYNASPMFNKTITRKEKSNLE